MNFYVPSSIQRSSNLFHHGWHLSFTTDLTDKTDGTDLCPGGTCAIRQKPDKPLGEDEGRCPCCHASALVL